jgi:hypothetical protein
MVRKLIGSALKKAGLKQRRNRFWMVVVKGDKYLLVSAAFFMTYAPDADQLARFESKEAAGERLKRVVLPHMKTAKVAFLGKYDLKKSATTYNDLYVSYATISADAPLPPVLHGFLQPLSELEVQTRTQQKIAEEVLRDLKKALDTEKKSASSKAVVRVDHQINA